MAADYQALQGTAANLVILEYSGSNSKINIRMYHN